MFFWRICCAVLGVFSLVGADAPACLLQQKPAQRIYYSNETLEIVIQSSRRIGHRLAAEVLKILVRDQLGYADVRIQEIDGHQDVSTVFNDWFNYNVVPKAMIDLNVLVPSCAAEKKVLNELLLDYGNVQSAGRFGFFIPKALHAQSSTGDCWRYYQEPNNFRSFDFDDENDLALVKKYSLNVATEKYICSEDYCKKGVYTPSHCQNASCATLLTSHPSETKFIVNYVDKLKLRMNVVWLGDNLKVAIDKLTPSFLERNKTLIFLEWSPGYFTVDADKLIEVTMPHYDMFASNFSLGCEFEITSTAKVIWKQIHQKAPAISELVHRMSYKHNEFDTLLRSYNLVSYEDTACSWLRRNKAVWVRWLPRMNSVTDIYIGGIFPLSDTMYNSDSIRLAASSAVEAVNDNKSILKNYRLHLLVNEAKCEANNVVKTFLGYVPHDYFNTLIGILGPACSETVEHILGISKLFSTIVISYSAEGASYSDRAKNPYFFRTIGENGDYKHVYLELFKHFGWNRVAALTEDGQKYTEYLSTMGDFIETEGMHLIANVKFPKDSKEPSLTRYLEDLKNKTARIIIADVYDEVARIVMCQAYQLNMTSKDGYVWFLPAWLPHKWYNTTHFNKHLNETVTCNVEMMEEAINGYFSLNHVAYGADDLIMQENMTVKNWVENYKNKVTRWRSSTNLMKIDPYTVLNEDMTSVFAGYTYDAVWMYAFAAEKVLSKHPEYITNVHSAASTKGLVDAIENMEFDGVSGKVKFYGGSRFPDIEITQWSNNKTTVIGSFYPNISNDRPELIGGTLILNNTLIQWFTSDGSVPSDGFQPPEECALDDLAEFLNMNCGNTWILLTTVCFTSLIAFLAAFIIFQKRRYERRMKFNEDLMKAIGFNTNGGMNLSNLDKWETNKECVVLNRILGAGAFGTVYGGEALLSDGKGWVAVAVKTLKIGSNREEKVDFLAEAEAMKRFDHKNIIKLLGVSTKSEPLYTIMEFMLYGDLKTYLLARRHLVNSEYTEEKEEISSKKLTAMALDIARALSYLAELKYVHRDVACRNCLVNAQRIVKLGDFGLTRPLYENDVYRFSRKGMLPVRWMAPESIGLGIFSPASDVWSFAVLLYEMITFGSFPFQGLSNNEALEHIKGGQTLKIPSGVKPQLEGLMKACWNMDYKTRPHASEIAEFLANSPRLISPCLDVPIKSVEVDFADEIDMLPEGLSRHTIPEELEDLDSTIDNITMLNSMHFDNPSYISADVNLNQKSKNRKYENKNLPTANADEEALPFV